MTASAFSEEYGRFVQLLVAARREAGLTQVEVASMLNKPQSFVSKYENGERRLDVVEFLHIARAIGFDYPALLRDLDEYVG